ncbi:MAG: phosphatase PAP2 family protein [Bacteroidetes bacterium]|nr:MAG: phosphatase PAP2 family protein [Bacteroidota bacterium]
MLSLLNILHTLDRFDHWLFQKINSEWTNPFFDFIFPYFRQSDFWMPLYLFLFAFVAVNFKRNWWWWIIFFLCTVALTDLVGTRLFKHVFERLRPCNDPLFASSVRLLLKQCAGGYSFVSNHAANHFGLATFFYFTLRNYLPGWTWIAWVWAFAICYAQIYVGIHYPLDIVGGALLGTLFGLFLAMFFNKKFGFANFDTQPTGTL